MSRIQLQVCFYTALILAIGCNTTKNINKDKAFKHAKADLIYASIVETQPDYQWYTGKARMKASSDAGRVSGTVHVRMLKDSAVWLRAEKFGFEVGRVMIRPDSVFILDRLNKQFTASSFQSFVDIYQAPFSFEDLQLVLAGGAVLFDPTVLNAERLDQNVRLTISNEMLKALYWMQEGLLLSAGRILDNYGRTVELGYADYRTIEGSDSQVPYERSLRFYDGSEKTELTMQYSQIEYNVPKSITFEIPNHYQKVD